MQRVIVDRELCESNAVCVGLSPELFELDCQDRLVIADRRLDDVTLSKAQQAVWLCPKRALSILDDHPEPSADAFEQGAHEIR